MSAVMLWRDVPENLRRHGSYMGWGPTQQRGCTAAVQWADKDGWHQCAGNEVSNTGFCRKHAEKLSLIKPRVRFYKRAGHRNETGEYATVAELATATECVECHRMLGVGEIIEPRRRGPVEAVCKECAGIHAAPFAPGWGGGTGKYLMRLRVGGCVACEQELTYSSGVPCPQCRGTGWSPIPIEHGGDDTA